MNKSPDNTKHWSKLTEAGSLFGFKFLLFVHRVAGRFVFKIVLYPVMAYFMLRRKQARQASLQYLSKHYQAYPSVWKKPPGLYQSFVHFLMFGDAILDKFLAWSAQLDHDVFDIETPDVVDDMLSDHRGQLIIGSHLGNLEYCRGFLQRYMERKVNILVYDQHAANFVNMMQQVNPVSRFDIYQVDQLNIQTLLLFKSKVENGEWIFIAGDRVPVSGEKNTTRADFLNDSAAFPIGPYVLANSLGCPVKLLFSYRYNDKVKLNLSRFNQGEVIKLDRKTRHQQLSQHVREFASTMEKHCAKVPYQWFNFYNFWKQNPDQNS